MGSDSVYLQTSRFGLGDAIVEGWHFYRKHFWTNILIGLIVDIPLIIYLILILASPSISTLLKTSGTGTQLATLIVVLATLPFIAFSTGSLTYLTSKTAYGEPAPFGYTLRHSLSRFSGILGTFLLQGLLLGLAFMALVIPGVYFTVRYAFGPIAASLRGISGMDALTYSKGLVETRWWRAFSALAAFYLFYYVITYLTQFATQNTSNVFLFVIQFLMIGVGFSILTIWETVYFLNLDFQNFGRTQAVSSRTRWSEQAAANSTVLSDKSHENDNPYQTLPPETATDGLPNEVNTISVYTQIPEENQVDAGLPEGITALNSKVPGLGVEPAVGLSVGAIESILSPSLAEPAGSLQPEMRNNDAVATLVLGIVSLIVACAGFIFRIQLSQIAVLFMIATAFTVYLGINGFKRSKTVEGKGKGLAQSGLGLGIVATALMAVLVFAPPEQMIGTKSMIMTYPIGWLEVDPKTVDMCQNYNCIAVLRQKDNYAMFYLVSHNYDQSISIEQIDRLTWSSIKSDIPSAVSLSNEIFQVDGKQASRRVYSRENQSETIYQIVGFILTESTAYEYIGVFDGKNANAIYTPEIDSMIQSIRFKSQ